MNEKDYKINDCLFCNVKNEASLTDSHCDYEPHYFYVRCYFCLAQGPKERSADIAVESWNKLMINKEK